MVVPTHVRASRRDFGRLFRDTCTINADDGVETFDPNTGTYTTTTGTEVYSGDCVVSSASSDASLAEVAGDIVHVSDYLVKILATEEDPEIGHRVTINSSTDGTLTGRVFRVKFVRRQAWTPNRWLLCEELEN